MSFNPGNLEQDIDIKELLIIIATELQLMNARIEHAFKTDIILDDIQTLEDGENGDSR